MRGNEIKDKGASALAANTTLSKLNLFEKKIGDNGGKAFLKNKTLKDIQLSNNEIDSELTKEIVSHIETNKIIWEKKNKLNWLLLAPLIASTRAHDSGKHPLSNSILCLLPEIAKMADEDFTEDMSKQTINNILGISFSNSTPK